MSEETLLSAARRLARFCRIDERHGGLMSIETLKALHTLDIQIQKADARAKAEAEPSAPGAEA